MRKKILQSFIQVITVAVTVTVLLMTFLTYRIFEERVMEDLRVNARVLGKLVCAQPMQTLIREVEKDLRVTLIEEDGQVIYDNRADPKRMGNHALRREVQEALRDGEGTDVRESETVDRSTFYYAVKLEDGSVLRVAQEASSIWSIYLHALPLFLLVMGIMIGLCILAAGMLTEHLIAPIEKMTANLDNVKGVPRYPELEPFMEMIEKQHDEILRSADMRVEFTANVSHELKTPLTSISGYAELIESGMAKGEQVTRFAGEIHKSANRLLTLINDIIRLSQMDAPMPDMKLEPVDLAQVAQSQIEQLKLSAQKMDVSMQYTGRMSMIRADRGMMEELIYNLCDNAIRYNVHGGSVRVEVRPVKDKVVVIVQDTGIGISKENQEHVFERFYRVDKSRSKATGGTGLGLAIVKHIAAKHNAEIKLNSELGRGTQISIAFERLGRG